MRYMKHRIIEGYRKRRMDLFYRISNDVASDKGLFECIRSFHNFSRTCEGYQKM